MYKTDEILSNVIKQTLTNKLKWKFLFSNKQISIYVAKKQLDKNKFLSFYLNINYIVNEIDIEDIVLSVELTTDTNTIGVENIVSYFYPKVIDLYYMIVNDVL